MVGCPNVGVDSSLGFIIPDAKCLFGIICLLSCGWRGRTMKYIDLVHFRATECWSAWKMKRNVSKLATFKYIHCVFYLRWDFLQLPKRRARVYIVQVACKLFSAGITPACTGALLCKPTPVYSGFDTVFHIELLPNRDIDKLVVCSLPSAVKLP